MALAALAEAAGKLKQVRRKGWIDRGVSDAESVADHSYRVALLAWALARARGLDAERAMLIGLVHDLAEAEVGDETPYDGLLDGVEPLLQAEASAADHPVLPIGSFRRQLERMALPDELAALVEPARGTGRGSKRAPRADRLTRP